MPRFDLKRLVLQPGQVLVMHGNLLHAGDHGWGDETHARLHYYIVPSNVGKNTYPKCMERKELGQHAGWLPDPEA